jgi:FkbM family methyltransferase
MADQLGELRQATQSIKASIDVGRQQVASTLDALREDVSSREARSSSESDALRDQLSTLASEIVAAREQIDRSLVEAHVRPGRPVVYLGEGVALTRTRLGHKIYVDTDDIGIGPHILLDGMWEEWITSFISERLEPGMVFVDVGAHVGWFTLLACAAVQPSGRVFAVEPQPRLASLLRSSLSVNGFDELATVFEVAVSDAPGEGKLFQIHNDSGKATLIPAGDGYTMQTEVRISTLDELIGDRPVDFIKVDAEGSEMRIVEGAGTIIEANPNVQLLIEYHPGHGPALAALEQSGFRLGYVEHDGSLKQIEAREIEGLAKTTMIYAKR